MPISGSRQPSPSPARPRSLPGGAKRLGRASALALAEAGADIAITFRNSSRDAQRTVIDITSFGVRAVAVQCDITDEASVKVRESKKQQRAGRNRHSGKQRRQLRGRQFANLRWPNGTQFLPRTRAGRFLVSREALKFLRQRRGKIVNMGSLGGLRPWADNAHYCSSKAALHMLTKVMAKALAPEIAVNCVAPGMIDWEKKRRDFHGRWPVDAHAAKWPGRRDRGCGAFFRNRAALYHRANAGRGWRAGTVIGSCGSDTPFDPHNLSSLEVYDIVTGS